MPETMPELCPRASKDPLNRVLGSLAEDLAGPMPVLSD